MAITILAGANGHAGAASTDGITVTAGPIDTTTATLLIMGLATFAPAGPGSYSDSKGNTWVLAPTAGATASANARVDLLYCKNPTAVGSGHTFQSTAANLYGSLCVLAFSGTNTTANRDQENATSSGTATIQPGSVTPTEAGEVLVTAIALDAAPQTFSIDAPSGFTILDQLPGNATSFGGSMAYLIQTTAAAANPTWTATGSGGVASGAVIVTFKAAAAAGPVIPVLMSQYRRRRD